MCGLAGVMGRKLDLNAIQKFKDIFLFAQVRGEDGAGMMSVPAKEHIQSVRVQRTIWSSGHLVTTQEFNDCIKGDVSIIVGHARQPTRGNTKIENVHPHRHKNILLVHNGTMTYIADNSIPVGASDSKLVAQVIAEKGPQGFVNSSYGAYALVWIDLEKQTINFLRNNDRPLYMVKERHNMLENSGTRNIYWASEMWMLNTGLGRYSSYIKERHDYFSLPVDEHWSYPLHVQHSIAAPTVTPCKRHVTSIVPYRDEAYGYGDMYGGYASEIWHGGNQDVSPLGKGGAGGTTNSPGFQYTPPEHRQVDKTKPVIQASAVLSKSKLDAELARVAALKGVNSPSANSFPTTPAKSLDQYVCQDHKRIRDMVSHAPCVWCSTKPLWKRVDGQDPVPPRIFPVRFTDTRGEYVCETCITDLDVQQMVGIAV
jgi:predicted glutamine amidotransferase